MIRFGTNPIAWSSDDFPELGGKTSLETCLTEARQAGFEGIELGSKFPREAETLRPLLAHHGLALVSGWYSSQLLTRSVTEEIAAIEAHRRLLADMGCTVLIIAETTGAIHGDRSAPLAARPRLTPEQIRGLARKLNEVGAYVSGFGMQLAYHHHMGTVIQSEEDIRLLMGNAGPHLSLLLDTGHATFAGADPVKIARDYRDRIAHIHCKDVRLAVCDEVRRQEWSFMEAVVAGVFTVPGDGDVPFAEVFAAMKPHRYEGWLVVEAEQDPLKANPARYAALGYANLRRLAEAVGMLE
ncbi:MAG TPA: myo-inosose-2 dehydratase [Dongiaceae bacterium]|jgi:inosose dehydratase|nr:myo-inosose-2 dehydratase [Dongiaceae bacterium]